MKKEIAKISNYVTGTIMLFSSIFGPKASIGALIVFLISLSFTFLA